MEPNENSSNRIWRLPSHYTPPNSVAHAKSAAAYKSTEQAGGQGTGRAEKLYIDPTECIDCGACVPVCPVSAIFPLDDLPEKWRHYAEIDASYVVGGKFQPDKFKK